MDERDLGCTTQMERGQPGEREWLRVYGHNMGVLKPADPSMARQGGATYGNRATRRSDRSSAH
jgi:hypothetical protein